MAYKQQKFISHSSGRWKPKIRVLAQLGSDEGPLPDADFQYFTVSSHGRKDKLALWDLFIRVLIPFMGVLPLWCNHLPKAPPPKTITLGNRFSTYEFGGDSNNQSIAVSFLIYKKEWVRPVMFKFSSHCKILSFYSETHQNRIKKAMMKIIFFLM